MKAFELRLEESSQPLTDQWQRVPIAPRGSTRLGISYRPLQAAAFGLEAGATLRTLLAYPFQIVRLGAYWNRMEPEPGVFRTSELDDQIEAAERAGKQIILCVGPLKTFGYPEFFVPRHHLKEPLPEHTLIRPSTHPSLLNAATEFIERLVGRYGTHQSIVAWQLEQDAVDPLGVEHSWRLDAGLVSTELEVLRKADPTRPVMTNGFLPTSLPVRLSQWWQTRDQGDSLATAQRLADMVGIDYYPRHALLPLGKKTLYLDGTRSLWQEQRRERLLDWAGAHGKQLLISEGQAEPWETATTPSNPNDRWMFSCSPLNLITNYNACVDTPGHQTRLFAYLFWGAECWVLRGQSKDPSYLKAFSRICENAG